MSRRIGLEDLGAAITDELTTYHREVTDRVNETTGKTIKELVKKTKATAPKGIRGSFKKNIASKVEDAGHGMKRGIWYVKAPDHRLTHLLVHGHATKDGGRTAGDPFLADALDQVLPDYEKEIEEAVRND